MFLCSKKKCDNIFIFKYATNFCEQCISLFETEQREFSLSVCRCLDITTSRYIKETLYELIFRQRRNSRQSKNHIIYFEETEVFVYRQ